jgi:hypothetical protein
MGVDIFGWVEVKPDYYDAASDIEMVRQWLGIISAGDLLNRKYDAFGCLFGVQNYANFIPVAAARSIPDNASTAVKQEFAEFDEAFGASWVTWAELKALDWSEEAARADSRIHQYERDAQGHLVYVGKGAWNRQFAEQVFAGQIEESMRAAILRPGSLTFPADQEWEIDGKVYRSEKLKRQDVLGDDWPMLFKLMETLASRFGDDGVRLVVWFSW